MEITDRKLHIVKIILISVIFIFRISYSQSDQDTPDKKSEKKIMRDIRAGDFHYFQKRYIIAINYYLDAYKLNDDDDLLNLKIGVCYLNSPYKNKCLEFFEKAYKADPELDDDILYYLARGCHLNYRFKQAIIYYKQYRNKLPAKNLEELKADINKKIDECRYGLQVMEKPLDVTIENLGENINSEFPDIRPYVMVDQNEIFYTSRREMTIGTKLDPFANYYYDNIYSANKKENTWQSSVKMPSPLNTQVNDAVVGISVDGKSMVIYNDQTNAGDLFITEYKNGEWSLPDRLPIVINSKFNESSATFSITKDTLYFVSDRNDMGFGGKDIYYSIRDDKGRWSEPVNLGPEINTAYNEDGVSMHPNGKKLFFSSEGHSTIGGYDIFITERLKNGNWSKPVNIGYPINTTDDDMYFYMTGENNIAYYSAIREGGYGDEDIYRIKLKPEQLYAVKQKELLPDPELSLKPEPEMSTVENVSGVIAEPEVVAAVDTVQKNNINSIKIQPEVLTEELPVEKVEDKYENLKEPEVIEKIFEPVLASREFKHENEVLEQAKNITSKLIKENTSINIEVLKKNPTKVIIEILDKSSDQGVTFDYPSGGKGTFVILLPKNIEYNVELEQKEISTTYGKTKLIDSKIKKEMISNNIISISDEEKENKTN